MGIGADLLAVPFADMVYSLADAIAKGQQKLDQSSLNTLKTLAHTTFDYIPDVTEVLEPDIKTIDYIDGNGDLQHISVTGVSVNSKVGNSFPMTLLQAGLTPTFYQFTQSVIEVKISLSSRVDTSVQVDAGFKFDSTVSTELGIGGGILGSLFGGPSGKISTTTTFSTHTDLTVSNKYSYSAEGSSMLSTTLKPVPPPGRVMPRFITVNALVSPPTVNVTD